MILLGIDIGSSSIKVSLLDGEKGTSLAGASYPPQEMEIISGQSDWAEQDPELWMNNLFKALDIVKAKVSPRFREIGAIGISYQMHGLVAVDKNGNPVRNAIIWCDSRAVDIGQKAFEALGEAYCLSHLLNSPGNFTASKLRWIKLFEPENFKRINRIMLPGDYIAWRLTGEITTTESGLSEGVFWDFEENKVSEKLLGHYGINKNVLPAVVGTFAEQGFVSVEMAERTGIKAGTPVTYRAGDQPNNAFSLNVLEPGEIAATAGTSGVVYGVSNKKTSDPQSRINTFLHVNHSIQHPRLGILMCLNSTGILNAWIKNLFTGKDITYEQMNELAAMAPAGSEGLLVFPFGNGAERILQNKNIGASFHNLHFNIHKRSHVMRAMQEGIVFALNYGIEIMKDAGLEINIVRAGMANMFLSSIFRETFAGVSGAGVELYNTDGAEGAARGAGLGLKYYRTRQEAFSGLKRIKEIEPKQNERLRDAYEIWKEKLTSLIDKLEIVNKVSGSKIKSTKS
jgi:xylulokinase